MPAEESIEMVRAERYRRYAAETLRLARAADAADIRATYLSLAACWKRLAEKTSGFDEVNAAN